MKRAYDVKWRSGASPRSSGQIHTMRFHADSPQDAVLQAQKWDSRFSELINVRPA